ncbi:MAG: hypothetical protein JRF58_10860, partial [Deltaproteobacteria bacterium]|nr:hypothetical protein [Deltaproteobacteria bacterium]
FSHTAGQNKGNIYLMLSQKLKKKNSEILREETIQKIYLDQFRAELDAIDPNLFVDAFPSIIHKKFMQELWISQFKS